MVGIHIPKEQINLIVRRTMKEADVNKDDAISFEEFKKVTVERMSLLLSLKSLSLNFPLLLPPSPLSPSLFLHFSLPSLFSALFFSLVTLSLTLLPSSLHHDFLQVLDNADIANKLSIQFSI